MTSDVVCLCTAVKCGIVAILVGMWLKLEGVGCASCFLLVKCVQFVTPHLSYIHVCFFMEKGKTSAHWTTRNSAVPVYPHQLTFFS